MSSSSINNNRLDFKQLTEFAQGELVQNHIIARLDVPSLLALAATDRSMRVLANKEIIETVRREIQELTSNSDELGTNDTDSYRNDKIFEIAKVDFTVAYWLFPIINNLMLRQKAIISLIKYIPKNQQANYFEQLVSKMPSWILRVIRETALVDPKLASQGLQYVANLGDRILAYGALAPLYNEELIRLIKENSEQLIWGNDALFEAVGLEDLDFLLLEMKNINDLSIISALFPLGMELCSQGNIDGAQRVFQMIFGKYLELQKMRPSSLKPNLNYFLKELESLNTSIDNLLGKALHETIQSIVNENEELEDLQPYKQPSPPVREDMQYTRKIYQKAQTLPPLEKLYYLLRLLKEQERNTEIANEVICEANNNNN